MGTKIPREHGLYVVLGSCWLIGFLSASTHAPVASLAVLLITLGAIGMLAPVRAWVRRADGARRADVPKPGQVSVVMAVLAVIASIYVIATTPLIALFGGAALAAIVVYLQSYRARGDMISQSFAGFIAATALVPAAWVAAEPTAQLRLVLTSWIATAAYFCGSVFAVRVRIIGRRAITPAVVYHACLLCAVALPLVLGWHEPSMLPSVLLACLRMVAIVMAFDRWRSLSVKRIGAIESVAAAIVVALVVAANQ